MSHTYHNVKTVAQFIAAFRAKQGLSQAAFADSFGVTPGYIGQLEKGKPKVPSEFIKSIYPLLDPTEREILKACISNTVLEGVED